MLFCRAAGIYLNMPIYSIPGFEEPFSCFSHLFAAPVFLVWGIWLIAKHGKNKTQLASLLALVVASVYLLSMSGVYHLLGQGTARSVAKQLDIAGVFALIAATATPVHMTVIYGLFRWIPVVVVWTVAATGITLRTIYSESLPLVAGTVIFLVMGWGGLLTCGLLWRQRGFQFVRLFLAGGIAYSVGAIVLILNAPTLIPGIIGPHELWHIAVLAGLALHWMFIDACMRSAGEGESQMRVAQRSE
ncbi:MAG: hemolysin III family protein [bacterium]|nr:hemolysin III family protein [bacterium]